MDRNKQQKKQVLIRVRGLKQYFTVKRSKKDSHAGRMLKANDDINLEIYEGETLGLVGESGCGKSTLGRGILLLNPVTEGEILYYGISMDECLPRYRYKMYEGIKKMLESGTQPSEVQTDALAWECLGGLLCSEQLNEVVDLLMKRYKALNQLRRYQTSGNHRPLESHQPLDMHNFKRNGLLQEIEQMDRMLQEERSICQKKELYEMFETKYEAGINLRKLTKQELRSLRKELQMIFQDPYSSLNPRMTAGELIGEGVRVHGILRKRKECREYVLNIMQQCGLDPYMLHRYPHQFSGGQRQRIGIARSLALQPRFVICDEAISALDVSIQSQIINLLSELKKKTKLTYLFISHDLKVIRYLSDRICVMYLGKMVELADCEDIFKNPMHPYTKALLSAIPDISRKNPQSTDNGHDADHRQTTEHRHGTDNRHNADHRHNVEHPHDAKHQNNADHPQSAELDSEIPSLIDLPKGCTFHTRCQYAKPVCETRVPEWKEEEKGHFVACHFAEKLKGEINVSRAAR